MNRDLKIGIIAIGIIVISIIGLIINSYHITKKYNKECLKEIAQGYCESENLNFGTNNYASFICKNYERKPTLSIEYEFDEWELMKCENYD